MPLESCMILLDNSEYMRNGDYTPNRLSAQHDAANLLITHKTQSNPESTVGVIAMSGGVYSRGGEVELLVSPTDDLGKILGSLHGLPIRSSSSSSNSTNRNNIGGVDVSACVQVASLALKHRRNKNGQQRIVMFVGSPLTDVDSKTLTRAGKTLKKNNVAIDVIAMGHLDENEPKLKEFVDAANGSSNNTDGERNCHLVTIPAGVLPSDALIESPIIHGGGGGGSAFAASAMAASAAAGSRGEDAFAEYGGVDPSIDPELAMALRFSMEEERARQERLARESAATAATAEGGGGETSAGTEGGMQVDEAVVPPSTPAGFAMDDDMGDEDALLQQALAMSMAESQPPTNQATITQSKPTETTSSDVAMEDDDDDNDDDAAMQMALQMSMQAESGGTSQQQFQDPQFVNQLLGSLAGVNPDDPNIQSALENLNKATKEGDSKSEKKDEDKK